MLCPYSVVRSIIPDSQSGDSGSNPDRGVFLMKIIISNNIITKHGFTI